MDCKNCEEPIKPGYDGITQSFVKDGLYYNSTVGYCEKCNFPFIEVSLEPIKPENTIFD